MPKVSVIVPVYNVERYLEKCVRSVLAQSERDFELLLVDDGSPDGCGALCDRLAEEDSRIRVIHQENMGLGGARNTGIEKARGEWLLFVDSDDWIEPDTLEKALAAGEREKADLVLFAFRSVTEEGKTVQIFREDMPKEEALRIPEHRDIFLTAPCAWDKLYRAELFARTGVRYPLRVWYEDIRTTLKLFLSAETAVFLNDVCYNYLLREGSITKNINADRNVEILDAFEDILSYFQEQGQWEKYRNELCFLTLFHLYLTASVRVIRIDRKHPLLSRFRTFLREQFPDYRRNPYLDRLNKKQKLLLFLLERRLYLSIELLFKLKG